MSMKVGATTGIIERPVQSTREVLVEQNLWLIWARWFAVGGIVAAVLVGSHSFPFPLLPSAVRIYICAAVLLVFNIVYLRVATKKAENAGPKDVVLAMVQVESDLVILTAVLYFSGGVANPFFLFYIFHVIIATIILPKTLSFVVGLTTIVLFGLLAFNELSSGLFLPHYHLKLPRPDSDLWGNPVYVCGAFVAFTFTVVLTQYLTRMIISRMTAKEMEASRNNEVLGAVISAMAEGLIFVTREGKVAICNPAAKRWRRDEHIDKEDDSLDDFPTPLSKHMKGLQTGDESVACVGRTIEFTTGGAKQYDIEVRSCPVIDVDGQELGYVVVGQDLTVHKKLERDLIERTDEITAINEMLKMSRVEMAQREKMVAIGQMATGIAHEIGNPLASLSSVVQYLGRKMTTHEEKENIVMIKHQVNRISNILKHMLSLSRPATAEYRWVDINDVIDNTLSLVKFDKRMRSVTIENVTTADLPMVWLNPQLFEQVLLNLFINALDAMSAKNTDDEHVLRVTRECEKGMIEVRVSDTGIGMSPEICQRAFDSFFTTKEIGKGTGLGLFISYNLITEVDGSIFLESELGKGTTVVVRIPIRPKKDLIGGEGVQADSVSSTRGGA